MEHRHGTSPKPRIIKPVQIFMETALLRLLIRGILVPVDRGAAFGSRLAEGARATKTRVNNVPASLLEPEIDFLNHKTDT